jgi:ABC-type tungstate transport system permease subunit
MFNKDDLVAVRNKYDTLINTYRFCILQPARKEDLNSKRAAYNKIRNRQMDNSTSIYF